MKKKVATSIKSGTPARRRNKGSATQLEIDFMAPSRQSNPPRQNNPLGDMEGPSNLALKHESEIASLRTQQDAVQSQLLDHKAQMKSLELSVDSLSKTITVQLDKITDKINAPKNQMVPIALSGLMVTVVGVAAGLIMSTINSRIQPIQEKSLYQDASVKALDDRQRKMGEDLMRIDERSRWSNLQKVTSKNAPTIPAPSVPEKNSYDEDYSQ